MSGGCGDLGDFAQHTKELVTCPLVRLTTSSKELSLPLDHEEKALPWVSSLGGAFSFLSLLVLKLLSENVEGKSPLVSQEG